MKFIFSIGLLFTVSLLHAQAKPGLDASFGNHGIILDSNAGAIDVVIQPDGKIVVAGDALRRYLPSGQPDNTFGLNGSAKLPAFPGGWPQPALGHNVHLLPDGNLIVANGLFDSGCIVRYKPNGQIDSTYGTNGITTAPFYELDCSTIQPDGKLLIAGIHHFLFPYVRVRRFNQNGIPDSSFGINGVVETRYGRYDGNIAGIEVLTDGRIVLGGIGYDSNENRAAMLMRYLPNGSPDTTLNHTGLFYPFEAGYCQAMILQSDGKPLLSVHGLTGDAYVCRFKIDGHIDSTFGLNGFAVVPRMRITTMMLLPNKKILCGGYDGDFVLGKLKPDGASLDSVFGINGVIRTDIDGGLIDQINAVAIQQDGKIIAVGGNNVESAIVRYLPNAVTGIKHVNAVAIHVYPNPAQDAITIDFGQSFFTNSSFRIYRIDGRLFSSGSLNSTRANVNVSGLVPGIYLLTISSHYFTETLLFTKQ